MLPFSIDKNNTLRELRVDKNSHLSRRVHTPPNPSHIFFQNCWYRRQSTINEYASPLIHEHRSWLLFHTVVGMGFEGSWWRILLQLETRRQQHCNEICLHFCIRPRCSLATFVSIPAGFPQNPAGSHLSASSYTLPTKTNSDAWWGQNQPLYHVWWP